VPRQDAEGLAQDRGRDLRPLRGVRRGDLGEAPRGAPRDHALHPLQRGPGARREGLRLSARAFAQTVKTRACAAGVAVLLGCAAAPPPPPPTPVPTADPPAPPSVTVAAAEPPP